MKKLVYLFLSVALLSVVLLSASCSKDDLTEPSRVSTESINDSTEPINLIETTWKYSLVTEYGNYVDISLLFISANRVERWDKWNDGVESYVETLTYTITNDSIEINGGEWRSVNGIIDNNTMNITIDSEERLFLKQ